MKIQKFVSINEPPHTTKEDMSDFEQPVTQKLERGTAYYYVSSSGQIYSSCWNDHQFDFEVLSHNNMYLSNDSALRAMGFKAAQDKKHIMPQWFRDLGPEFLVRDNFDSCCWHKYSINEYLKAMNENIVYFTTLKPAHFKPLPNRVTHVLNGKEYSWPEPHNNNDGSCRFGVFINFHNNEKGVIKIMASNNGKGHSKYSDAFNELEYILAKNLEEYRKPQ